MASVDRHHARQHRTALSGVEAIPIDSDRSFPRHAHEAYGFGVMIRGGHASWSGRGPVEAGPGDVITVNPGEVHDGRPAGDAARGWRMLFLDLRRMDAETDEERTGEVAIARPVVDDRAAARLILRAFAHVAASSADALAAEESLTLATAHLVRHHGARSPARLALPASVALARRRLDEAPEQPVSLGELAALAGISRFQLVRGFARSLGTTPHAYLVSRRVALAREALKADTPPAAAAALAGFADQSHLTRAFVRQFGVTPGRYRAAVRG